MTKAVISLLTVSAFAAGTWALVPGPGASKEDVKAVERAVLDYCEAFYEMKPELLERSVHPEVNKFGFHRPSPDEPYRRIPVTFDQLVTLAATWNQDAKFGKDASKEVAVFDVMDQTAAAKLIAGWGIDYMHLAKYDGTWKVVQVIWQSHPLESASAGN